MMDPNDEQIKRQRERVIKAFEDLAVTTANNAALAKKQIEMMNKQIEIANKQIDVVSGLIEALMMPKDGMRDVIDEVLEEIRGLREDIRVVAQTGGADSIFRALLGKKPR